MNTTMNTIGIQIEVCKLLRANTSKHMEVCVIVIFIKHSFNFISCYVCFVFTHSTHLGAYHQYDTVVYPKDVKSPKSWYERTKEKAKSFFGIGSGSKSADDSKEEDLKILNSFEMGKLCLQVYLHEYKEMLRSGSFPKQANLQSITEEICHIYNLLYHPFIFYQNTSVSTERRLDGRFTEVCLFPHHFATFSSS